MGGFFGVVSKRDAISDVFFGTDYHSHLGTHRAGIAAFDPEIGLQREIKSIQNAPFRTKFEYIFETIRGTSAIGCISDYYPQPLLIRSSLGTFGLCLIGDIQNADELMQQYLIDSPGGHFDAMTGGKVNIIELVAAMISQKGNFCDGIRWVQESIRGSATMLILKEDGNLIAARDKLGRLPVMIGYNDDGYCVSFESFAINKLAFEDERELGPGEVVEITPTTLTQLRKPEKEMKICAFLWSYFGYPNSCYEGKNVEIMRYRNGAIMAKNDKYAGVTDNIDYVGGVPDSGTPHAIGYANESHSHFARAFIKYTPTWSRSFTPTSQKERSRVAKMKQIPIHDLIIDKNLLFVDDSIVRGTQLKETVDFLYDNGAKSVHMRSACPPIMYGCKYLNFSRSTSDMDLISRKIIMELEGEAGFNYIDEYSNPSTERGKNLRKTICDKFKFASLEFQTLDGIVEAIGLPKEKLCTYCWDGRG